MLIERAPDSCLEERHKKPLVNIYSEGILTKFTQLFEIMDDYLYPEVLLDILIRFLYKVESANLVFFFDPAKRMFRRRQSASIFPLLFA